MMTAFSHKRHFDQAKRAEKSFSGCTKISPLRGLLAAPVEMTAHGMKATTP